MDQRAVLGWLAIVGCSGTAPRSAEPAAASSTVVAAPVASDPTRAFRLQYANPGGMWLPQQMTLPVHVETLRSLGAALEPRTLSDPLESPLAAVVALGGCTGSFVSPDGLVATNHHCVQAALQQHTNKQAHQDYVEDGFLANTRADERSAGPAQRMLVAQAFRDVTAAVRDGLDQIADPIARKTSAEHRMKALLAACEQGRPGVRCSVKPYFGGGLYLQTESLELRDVRLVYAPARSIGDYGGETDNWGWPRHTGDWAFLRAYVGKDGAPADYAPDNVPFHPRRYLRVSTAGLAPGDFVLVPGYPGSTIRTATAASIHHQVEWALPYVIASFQQRYAIAEAHAGDASETGTKAVVLKQQLQNAVANQQGVLAGLTKGDLLAQKDALDRRIKDWAAQPGHEALQPALARLEQLGADERRTARADYERRLTLSASRLLFAALTVTRWADERAKPDADRRPGNQDRDLDPAVAGQKQLARAYDRTLDRAMFRLSLVRALQLPEAERGWLAALLDVKPGTRLDAARIDRTLDAWYAATRLEDEQVRTALLSTGTLAQLRASRDPFVRAAVRVWPTVKAEDRKTDARQGELLLVTPAYVEAMKQVLGGQLAPDANLSLRITYGTVRSFSPSSSAVADRPFTTANQILGKDTGTAPFHAPGKLLDAIRARTYGPYADRGLGGELPVDFLCDVDTTGGSSGSPVLDRSGALVGLLFDGTLDGVVSDVVFHPSTTRSIAVDARYMIWVMDLLDGADHLVAEMGLVPRLRSTGDVPVPNFPAKPGNSPHRASRRAVPPQDSRPCVHVQLTPADAAACGEPRRADRTTAGPATRRAAGPACRPVAASGGPGGRDAPCSP